MNLSVENLADYLANCRVPKTFVSIIKYHYGNNDRTYILTDIDVRHLEFPTGYYFEPFSVENDSGAEGGLVRIYDGDKNLGEIIIMNRNPNKLLNPRHLW